MPYGRENRPVQFMKMTVLGKGSVTVDPDLAILQLGVQTTGDNVTEAQTENAEISQNVINALKQLQITEIKTIQYQINKMYDYVDGKQIDRGYQVRNIFEIRMNNLAEVGTVIDTAVYYGANVVNSVTFDVEDPDLYYQKALNLAVDNAVQKAQSIADGLGIAIDPVPVLITENSAAPVPYRTAFSLGEVATPVEPGSMQITAEITAEFRY
jgi:uncharacterized protein YggE